MECRRLVVELRDTPVELISKRLAKALLAPRLRPVAHIHRARTDQGGGRADDRKDEIPTGQPIHVVAVDHQQDHVGEEKRQAGDDSRAKDINDPSLDAPPLLPLRLILPQRQPE